MMKAGVQIGYGMIYLTLLESLDLSYNDIGPEGAAAIGEALSSLIEQQYLDLSHNAIVSIGAEKIGIGLNSLNDKQTKLRIID